MKAKIENKTAYTILFAILVVAAFAIYWALRPASPVTPPVSGPTPYHAPAGQLVAGFPQTLILGGAPQVSDSYGINYSSSTNQYTAEWNSSSSMSSLYASYQSYFTGNGWTIVNNNNAHPTLRALYATGSSGSVNVVITPDGSGSQVVLSFDPTQ